MPSLQLNDKVLTNVTVMAISPAYIMAKWDGGRGSIARASIPSFPPEAVDSAPVAVMPPVVATTTVISTQRKVYNGQPLWNPGEYGTGIGPNDGKIIANCGPNFTAENFDTEFLKELASHRSAKCGADNPMIIHEYKLGVSIPLAKLTEKNLTRTPLEMYNSVASFNGIEIPFARNFDWEVAAPSAASAHLVGNLKTILAHKPKYTPIALPPVNTVTLYTPYQILGATYGKDLDTVIKIKLAMGNNIPELFWKQAIPFFCEPIIEAKNWKAPSDMASGICGGGVVDSYAASNLHLPCLMALTKMQGAAGPCVPMGTPAIDYLELNRIVIRTGPQGSSKCSSKERLEGTIQHEISHMLDGVTPAFRYNFIQQGRYRIEFSGIQGSNSAEIYTLASLLNRAHYLLFGEPITNREQALNMLALVNDATKEVRFASMFSRPARLTQPLVPYISLPGAIQGALSEMFGQPSLRTDMFMEKPLADAWISFYAKLAL